MPKRKPADDPVNKNAGRILGMLMGFSDDTQEEVAAYLDLHQTTVHRLLRGDASWTASLMHQLAQRYGVNAALFLEDPTDVLKRLDRGMSSPRELVMAGQRALAA